MRGCRGNGERPSSPQLGTERADAFRETCPCSVDSNACSWQVWNRDMPHSRAQCGVHPFSALPSASNGQHCPHCFCYVCDVEASKCQRWGQVSIMAAAPGLC